MVFSAIALWHLVKNWRSFTAYLRRRPALAAFGLALIVSVAVTAMTGTTSNASPGAVFGALSRARLEVAAPAFGLDAPRAIAALQARGIAAMPGETLGAIGARAGRNGAEIASILAQSGRR